MVKSEEEVVKEFNGESPGRPEHSGSPVEIVNMTADELEAFLKTEGSESTGWSKDDGSGESIGHESGRKIVDILKRNPGKVRMKSSALHRLTGRTRPSTPTKTRSTCARLCRTANDISHRRST